MKQFHDEVQNAEPKPVALKAEPKPEKVDVGVPMLPGSPDEPQGPEDALGEGPKRGDYTDRIGDSHYQPHDGLKPQRPNVAEIGDVPGVKGGVDTAN